MPTQFSNTYKAIFSNNRVRVFTGSGLITGSDRIGPDRSRNWPIPLLNWLFFLYKNDVHKRLCIKCNLYALEYINIDINGKKTKHTQLTLFAMVSYQFTPVVFYIKWHAQVYPLFSIKKPIFLKLKQAIIGIDVINLILKILYNIR